MGGIYTQSRETLDLPYGGGIDTYGTVRPPFALRQLRPTQTTTSFRSRGSVVGADDALALSRTLSEENWLTYSQYDTGHPFDTIKETWRLSHPSVDIKGRFGTMYQGPLVPRDSSEFPGGSNHGFVGVPDFDSGFYGTAAINRTQPAKPAFDMANALGELRTTGGVPSVMGTILSLESRAKFSRSVGKEYLNSVFGWAPLVGDVERLCNAVIQSEKIVSQYLRDSGRNIRRKYRFPIEASNDSIKGEVYMDPAFAGLGYDWTNLFNTGIGVSGFGEAVVNHTRSVWFSGAYTYLLEVGEDPFQKLKTYAALARKLVGFRISPEVLWELQPWSWLVDWVFNIGSILENIESFQTDGLVLRYGYLMCTDEVDRTVTVYQHGLPDHIGPVSINFRTVRKQRVKATPYGFGLDPTTWSPERWAILAALGLTKTPTSLR